MAEKLSTKLNTHDSFGFDVPNDYPSSGANSLTGWGDDSKDTVPLYFPKEKKKKFQKVSESTHKLPLRTVDSSKNVVTTLASIKNYTRSEQMYPTAKISQMASNIPKKSRTNIEIQNKIDLSSQAKLNPCAISVISMPSLKKRAPSSISWKIIKKVEDSIISDHQILNNVLKAVKAKAVEPEPVVYRRSSISAQQPSPIAKGRESVKLKPSPRAASYRKENESHRQKDPEDSPRHHIPAIIKKKIPKGCFNAFNTTNSNFARKTYMGISRLMNDHGPWVKTSLIEGPSIVNGESAIQPGNYKEEKTNLSETKMYLNRVLMNREPSKEKVSILIPNKTTWIKESGSKTDRATRRSAVPMYAEPIEIDKVKLASQGQIVLEKLKVKMKSSKSQPKGVIKTYRPRSKEYPNFDDLNLRGSNLYDNNSNNTSLLA